MQFLVDIILVCIRWCTAYPLSCRHLEEILAAKRDKAVIDQIIKNNDASTLLSGRSNTLTISWNKTIRQ
ncbi:hypothetical protein NSMM_820004 [Nitrosomonas mobilis]|uniref:Uncharacterized protein n=1 Tax=Nitrosomonas mobilis TaxID=51642 RepID=A0A1G5SKL4_9PROT|nr:hypothetical protein NSMM_820004 [Nitrosomonas mobilis]